MKYWNSFQRQGRRPRSHSKPQRSNEYVSKCISCPNLHRIRGLRPHWCGKNYKQIIFCCVKCIIEHMRFDVVGFVNLCCTRGEGWTRWGQSTMRWISFWWYLLFLSFSRLKHFCLVSCKSTRKPCTNHTDNCPWLYKKYELYFRRVPQMDNDRTSKPTRR